MALLEPGPSPSVGDRIRGATDRVVDRFTSPIRAVGRFLDRVRDRFGREGTVRDTVDVTGDRIQGVIPRMRERDPRLLKPEHYKSVRPGVVEEVAEMLARDAMAEKIEQNMVETWKGDSTNNTVVQELRNQVEAEIPDDAGEPDQVEMARGQLLDMRVRRQMVAGIEVLQDQIEANMTEANRITPLTNEISARLIYNVFAKDKIHNIGEYERARAAVDLFRERAVEEALREYKDHHLRGELRKGKEPLKNEVNQRVDGLLVRVDVSDTTEIANSRRELEADPVAEAILKNKREMTLPSTGEKVGRMDRLPNRQKVREAAINDLLGHSYMAVDENGVIVEDINFVRERVNEGLQADITYTDAASVVHSEKLIDSGSNNINVDALKQRLLQANTGDEHALNLAILMELYVIKNMGNLHRKILTNDKHLISGHIPPFHYDQVV